MRAVSHGRCWSVGPTAGETRTTAGERDCLATMAAGQRRLEAIGVWHDVTNPRPSAALAPDGVLLAVDPFPAGRP